jgi:alpha-glucosidase
MTLSIFFRRLFAGVITAFAVSTATANGQAAAAIPQLYEPHAAPEAVVTVGHARFTVLTPQLIRMEWASVGKFEDHASFAFLNRRLAVPQFQLRLSGRGVHRILTLHTSALQLTYNAAAETPKFDAQNLAIAFNAGAVSGVWHPGAPDTGNLGGTTRTLDRVEGSNVKLEPGLISRAGWALVDDSARPLFDSSDFSVSGDQSPWPWVCLGSLEIASTGTSPFPTQHEPSHRYMLDSIAAFESRVRDLRRSRGPARVFGNPLRVDVLQSAAPP